MKLIEPTVEYSDEVWDYRREFLEFGGSMDGCGPLRRMSSPDEWFAFVEAVKRPETAPDGMVPALQFIYVRESDERIVGMIQIRLRFNEYLEKYAGHIGYSVRPSERRKGFASAMLREAKPICASLGIRKVLISCAADNEGSRRTILKNGGVYESTVYLAERDLYLERYWIDT